MTSGALNGPCDRRRRVTSGEHAPQALDRLLRLLPEWFGIESANAGYVVKAHELPTYLAWPAGGPAAGSQGPRPAGVLLAARHFPASAEVYLLAVAPALHRRGIRPAPGPAPEAGLPPGGAG